MQWASVGDFFAMGGYALYVWGSFGMCFLLMGIEPFLARGRLREASRSIAREQLANSLANEHIAATHQET